MKLKGELNSLLSFLHHLPSDESGDVTAGTKRKTTTVSACSSTPKRPCIQLDPGIEDQSGSASTSSVSMQQSPDVTVSKYNFNNVHPSALYFVVPKCTRNFSNNGFKFNL